MAPPMTATTHAVSALLWFRKGLRLHDSPALVAACQGAAHVYPVYCLDPADVASGRAGGAVRLRFLAQCLTDLDASLREKGSRLIVLRGAPEEEIPRALAACGATRLVYEKDELEPRAIRRDAAVRRAAAARGVAVVEAEGHTMVPLDELLREAGGKPVTVYAAFQRQFAAVVRRHPMTLAPTPHAIPPPGAAAAALGDGRCAPPDAAELAPGLEGAPTLFPGGEREALRRLAEHLALDAGRWAASFEKPKTNPAALANPAAAAAAGGAAAGGARGAAGGGGGGGAAGGAGAASGTTRATTVLSPYLALGCLSPRKFWLDLAAATRGAGVRSPSEPPVSLAGQLLWREFYMAAGKAVGPAYEVMEGNPICRQVPWRPVRTDPHAAAHLAAWREGRTGYPWIDAVMRQLAQEGWVHHLARHAVACFLTRGDLWISWEEGARVFEERLVDWDWALNAGNWMWLSCSCFFYQYFRCYSPVAFGKKWDADGAYVRRYVPELARYPTKFLFEPWKAPIADQRKWGCRVGQDYPARIVLHESASKENMGRMAEAYAKYKPGTPGKEPASASAAPKEEEGGEAGAAVSPPRPRAKQPPKQGGGGSGGIKRALQAGAAGASPEVKAERGADETKPSPRKRAAK